MEQEIQTLVTVYPKLEKDHESDKFDRIFRSVAKSQGVDKFFAPVFNRMLVFMYSVITNNISTTKGEEIVKTHELTKDSQNGTQRAKDLLLEITTARIPEIKKKKCANSRKK